MTADPQSANRVPDVLKALGDPIRWRIVSQMALVDELACVTLDATLPISKPTISYHIKILYHAGLINVRKEGRNYFYTLRREALQDLLASLGSLNPERQVLADAVPGGVGDAAMPGRHGSAKPVRLRSHPRASIAKAAGWADAAERADISSTAGGPESVILTW